MAPGKEINIKQAIFIQRFCLNACADGASSKAVVTGQIGVACEQRHLPAKHSQVFVYFLAVAQNGGLILND